jgi:hypothetical protein
MYGFRYCIPGAGRFVVEESVFGPDLVNLSTCRTQELNTTDIHRDTCTLTGDVNALHSSG